MESQTFNDFRKGISDSYLGAAINAYAVLNNLLLDETGVPYTRYGWQAFTTKMTVSASATRPSGVYIGSSPYELPVYVRKDSAYFLNESDTWTEIVGPSSNVASPNKTVSDLESLTIWNKQLVYASDPITVLPHRIYCSALGGSRAFKALTLGLPALASAPTAASNAGAGTFSYIYGFHYYYEFTDYDGTIFVEEGPITTVSVTSATAISTATIALAVIPALANTSSTNYDTSTSLKIRVSRTVNNGSTFYFLTDVSNGTTTYNDTVADATLDDNQTMYTDGGILQHTQPLAKTKFVTQVNNYFWYASKHSITHSIQGAPGAVPAEYEQPVDQDVIGLSATISYPILFCDSSIYRIEGVFDEFGDGGFELREVHPSAGCVSNRSIVRIPGGLVWAGNGGFYFTDGQQVLKLSKSIEASYQVFKNSSITGAFDSLRNIVFWTISGGNSTNIAANDKIVALHLNFGLVEDSTFTTQSSSNNIYPNCLAYSSSQDIAARFKDKLLIGEARGYLVVEDRAFLSDHRIDTAAAVSAFKLKTIQYVMESSALNFGTDATRKYISQLSAILDQETETSVQFLTRRDDGGAWGTLSEIRKDGALTWGLTEMAWNSVSANETRDPGWNSLPIVDGMRHFPAGSLRSTRRQIGLTNSFTYIAISDVLGLATSSVVATTPSRNTNYVDLNDPSQKWPDDCEDYQIFFSGDGYVTAFTVKNRTSDTRIEVIDPLGTMPVGATLKWQMRGYRKNERIGLESFTVHFDNDSQTMTPSRGTAGMVNA